MKQRTLRQTLTGRPLPSMERITSFTDRTLGYGPAARLDTSPEYAIPVYGLYERLDDIAPQTLLKTTRRVLAWRNDEHQEQAAIVLPGQRTAGDALFQTSVWDRGTNRSVTYRLPGIRPDYVPSLAYQQHQLGKVGYNIAEWPYRTEGVREAEESLRNYEAVAPEIGFIVAYLEAQVSAERELEALVPHVPDSAFSIL